MKHEIHFNDLPKDIYVELKDDFREKLFRTAISSIGSKSKTSLGKIFNTHDTQTLRLWSQETRLTIEQLEKLQEITKVTTEDIERSITSIGIRSDNKKRIYGPKLPFSLKDLVYVYSHFVFDGCVSKKYSYFMAVEEKLLEYHRSRLQNFGGVNTNFSENDKQLFIPRTLVNIIKDLFNVNSFKSLEATIPVKLKTIAIENKEIANEIIKAAITDDSWVEDKVSFSVSNERLSRDVWEITKTHYTVGKFPEKPRIRIGISGKDAIEWKWSILSSSLSDFQRNIKLPLTHKQERIDFAVKRQNREWYKRKPNETKKLIIKSLLEKPKSIKELCFELNVRTTSIQNLINGIHCSSQNTFGLKELGIVGILEYKRNTPGERTGKFPVYTIVSNEKARKFCEQKIQ